jgi:hypothetical protein
MSLSETLTKAVGGLTKWGAVGASSVVFLGYLALELGLFDFLPPGLARQVLIAAAILVVLGIAVQLVELYGQVKRLHSDVSDVLLNASWQLLPLQACQADLATALRDVAGRRPVVLHHLGLTMRQAWPRMVRLLAELGAVKDLAIHLLMTSPQLPDGTWATSEAEVQRWREAAQESLTLMKDEIQHLDSKLLKAKSRLRIEVRGYHEFPLIHGFAMVEPNQLRCFSYCRWAATGRIDWGEDRYRKILGQPLDPSLADMVDIFDSAFARLWKQSQGEVLLIYDSAKPTHT